MTTQRRAAPGGELGVNGEWYEGGKFIATREDRPKQAPPELVAPNPEAARIHAEAAARAAQIAAWLEARRSALADTIAALTARCGDWDASAWQSLVENHQAGFAASLGRTLYMQGSLSPKQAEHAAKILLGRRTKATGAAWDALLARLTEEMADA